MSDHSEMDVIGLEKSMRIPREVAEKAKVGLGAKRIKRMRREAVACPMIADRVSFVQCYVCENFIRRIRGRVHCRYRKPENGV